MDCMATMRRFSHSCEREIMSTVAFPSTVTDPQAPAGNAVPPTVIRSAQDVSRIVNAGAAKGSNARIVIAIALGGVFLDAYDLTSLAYGIKDIARQFSLSPVQVGFVSSAITFGAILGALFGGYLTDRIGRYRVFMADMLFFVVAAIAAGLAPNAWVLGGARFLMGFGVGLDLPVAMAFLAEFSRVAGKGNKAASVAAWCPAWYAATSTCYLLLLGLYAILPEHQLGWLWRLTLAFGAVPAIAIIFGLPVIITSFFHQGPLTTIIAALALNLAFAFVGGLIGVRTAPTVGAWKMTVLGHSLQFASLIGLALIGKPGSGALVVVAILLLGGYLFGQGFGPGSHSMTYASLSYPTSLRGIGVGFNQTLVRSASTVSLFLFPVLAAALGTKVFWVIAIAPLSSLLVLLAIRWEPSGYDIDAEDYEEPPVKANAAPV
jgi:MFS family permease